MEPDKVSVLVMAMCTLHNLIRAGRLIPAPARCEAANEVSSANTETFGDIAPDIRRVPRSVMAIRDQSKDYIIARPVHQ